MTQLLCIIVYLFVSSYIVFSKGCILLSTGGCARGHIAFGGRLVLVGNDGAGVGDISGPLIFVTPFDFNSYRKFPFGYGRGQIWKGKRNCLGQSPQSHNNCPEDESRPCLDTTAPCFTGAPVYKQDYPLSFSDVTNSSITVTWPEWDKTTGTGTGPITEYRIQYREQGSNNTFPHIVKDSTVFSHKFDGLKEGTTYEFRIILVSEASDGPPSAIQTQMTPCGDLNDSTFVLNTTSKVVGKSRISASWGIRELSGSCEVSQQVIKIQQLDYDGCILPSPSDTKVESLTLEQRKKTFPKLDAYSKFNITLTVTHPSGVYTFSKIQRSAETAPEEPQNVRERSRKKGVVTFEWDEPPCYKRHGKIVKYGYFVLQDNKKSFYRTTKEKKTSVPLKFFAVGSHLTFNVRAYTSKKQGPFSSVPFTFQ